MDFSSGSGTRNLSTLDSKARTHDINGDDDIAGIMRILRDLALGTADSWDDAADRIFTRLYEYDKGQRGRLGRQRAKLVVAPIRHFAAGQRLAHRFATRVMAVYRREYAEDIQRSNAAKSGGKKPFEPGKAA